MTSVGCSCILLLVADHSELITLTNIQLELTSPTDIFCLKRPHLNPLGCTQPQFCLISHCTYYLAGVDLRHVLLRKVLSAKEFVFDDVANVVSSCYILNPHRSSANDERIALKLLSNFSCRAFFLNRVKDQLFFPIRTRSEGGGNACLVLVGIHDSEIHISFTLVHVPSGQLNHAAILGAAKFPAKLASILLSPTFTMNLATAST